MSYSDFIFTIEEELCIGLSFSREIVQQMFAYMDRDKDGALKLADFVRTLQDVQQGYFVKEVEPEPL